MSTGITYDAGALIAAEADDRWVWLVHRSALEIGLVPVVPAAVLAQVWTGGNRQVSLRRFLTGCTVDPLDRSQAQRVGELAGRADHHDTVDVSVVDGAARRGHRVLTSDPGDLRSIAEAGGLHLDLERV